MRPLCWGARRHVPTADECLERSATIHEQRMKDARRMHSRQAVTAMALNSSLRQPSGEGDIADVLEQFKETISNMERMPAEKVREHQFTTLIAPRLAEMGWKDRYLAEPLREESGDTRVAKQREVLAKIVARFKRVGAIIALVGPRGTGKTTIGAALATLRLWEDLEHNLRPDRRGGALCRVTAYHKLQAIVSKLKGLYGDFGTVRAEALEDYRANLVKWEILVIDEIGDVIDGSKFADRILADIIDLRYSSGLDTLLMSNQTREDFQEKINPSILSRLNEHGGVIPCEWESFRERPVKGAK